MKLTTVIAASLVALAPVEAWRVYLYPQTGQRGTPYTAAGPGNPGFACHTLPREHQHKAFSIEYYAYNSQTNPTTRCKIRLFDRLCGDAGFPGPYYSVDTKKDIPSNYRGLTTHYSTDCWRV